VRRVPIKVENDLTAHSLANIAIQTKTRRMAFKRTKSDVDDEVWFDSRPVSMATTRKQGQFMSLFAY